MISTIEEKVVSDWINGLFEKQKNHSIRLRNEPISARKKRLELLRKWVLTHKPTIQQALYDDFRKPAMEVEATEIFPVIDELSNALVNLHRWSKPKKIDAPLTMLGTRSEVRVEPKGICLIMAPWNYPFNLCIGPLVSALAAGNCVVIKPSEMTPNTSALIKKLCDAVFDEEVVTVCEGGIEVSQHLLKLPFDHIFFTGSPAVGKIVMKAAAEHLASVTLELGGKSPAIVTASANCRDAAKRIAVSKFVNNGQTCIAPDYVLVHESIKVEFIEQLKEQIGQLFGKNVKSIEDSPHYARIVNAKHFERLNSILTDALDKGARLAFGGQTTAEENFIHPTILTNVPEGARVLQEEIFGPLLPVNSFSKLDEVITLINQKPKPLALYVFGSNKTEQNKILSQTSSGGACINDCAVHFLHRNLPFGGVNNSGIGKSHGYYGFMAFSNEKPVLRQQRGFTSFQLFYPPYSSRAVKKLMDWLLKFI
ncbi:MAG: aldehyde dehydrogenase family protein [Cyclobacteriaceae bacterium]|nr:aldehyde dehydrogenase family protein [Cyclobacteriaceae bacterium]UYN86746.1 MAG: aldehyde dehydrogenase family protein [Cyclobacteriaceae bacterium]